MMTLTTIVATSASALFGVFLEVALKGTLLMAPVAAMAIVLRRATASLRHLLWSFSLIAMLAIPALSVVVPQWRLGILPAPASAFSIGDARAIQSQQPTAASDPSPAARDPYPYPLAAPGQQLRVAGQRTPVSHPGTSFRWPSDSQSLMDSLALLWLGGVLAGLIAIVGGLATLRRLARRSVPIVGAEWETLLAELKAELRITRSVRLLITSSAAMPATWGVLRPVVLLPADAENWDRERRRVVLLHELAHVQRNDYLMQFIAQICCTLYWFHPGVWYASRQLRAERELACDEHVLGAGINACDYAEHLLEIALTFRSPARASIAGVAMARPSQLEGRLHAILSEDVAARWRASRPMRAAMLATLAALSLPLAAMRPWRDAPSATNSDTGSVQRTAHEVVASLSASALPDAAADTFRWKGSVPAGQWVEVLSLYGDIRAELSTDREVEIRAVTKSGDARAVKIGVDKSDGGARFCAISTSVPDSPKPCGTGASGELRNGLPDVRVDFLIKLPAEVGMSAHTGRGSVTAESVKSYVWATSGHGDVRINTTDLAEATVRVGSIFAQFGRRSWRQNLEFLTEDGDVTVLAPSNARMMIEADTKLGKVRSEFPGEVKPFDSGQRIFATVGGGGGMLTLRTARGSVELRRGSAVAEASDMPVSYAGAPRADVDPKPNPNEDPGADPDPNPNPDVEVRTSSYSDDDPTGERVPVTIPDRLLDRFANPTIRTWPDAQAIGRLRDIAATHVKQHPADLVRERSEWALTLVRNGEIVMPLRNALRGSDWRERAYAAWALAETRDPRAADPLTNALGDSHWRVRMHAAGGLQRVGTARAVDPLIAALSDEYWQVRISAIDALAAIGDRRALPSLRLLAERDSRPFLRNEARRAIERIE